jgi:hypothetical protein
VQKTKTVRKITEWNPIVIRSKGRLKSRWWGVVLNDLRKLNVKNWTYVVKEREAWYKLMQKMKTHKVL